MLKHRFRVRRLIGAALLLGLVATGGNASAADAPFSSASSSSALWPAVNGIDGTLSTVWTSAARSAASSTETFTGIYPGGTQINYIKIYPRMVGNQSFGFPENFSVSVQTAAGWQTVRQYSNYPRPYKPQFIIIPLPSPMIATAVRLEASKLRTDDIGIHYYFQLGEFLAGYDAGYNKLQYLGNNGSPNEVDFENMSSGPFNPSKMKVWNYDRRNPIIPARQTNCQGVPSWRNVYGANATYVGPNTWRIFFGGYNGLWKV